MQTINTARALIYDQGQLLLFKLRETDDYWCLPGGKMESGEGVIEAINRELVEETGIKPVLGKLVAVHELADLSKAAKRIEFFFWIENAAEYRHIDFAKTSHGFEISRHEFVDLESTKHAYLPRCLKDIIAEIKSEGIDQLSCKIYQSS